MKTLDNIVRLVSEAALFMGWKRRELEIIRKTIEYLQSNGLLMVWQPMETAPKDRTPVLLQMPNKKVTYGVYKTGKEQGWWGYDGSRLKSIPVAWTPLPKAGE